MRTVNVTGSVWNAGKDRAAEDEVSVSHAVFLEAYSSQLVDLDTLVAQLDALHADEQDGPAEA